jgi:branched-chain amino acid transport system substrate-binding protein
MKRSTFALSAVATIAAVMLSACGKKEEAAAPAASAPASAPVAAADSSVIKIGHVAPTSGGIAHLGKDNEYGARLAVEELNAKGLTIGGKKVKFELVAEDDAGKARLQPRSSLTPRSTAWSVT